MTEYVTLVRRGGTPIRLADAFGAPYPTSGSGSLVFSDSATFTNCTFANPTFVDPTYEGDYTFAGTLTVGTLVLSNTLAVSYGGTGVTSSTGSGDNVLSASPTLTGTLNTGNTIIINTSGLVQYDGSAMYIRTQANQSLYLGANSTNLHQISGTLFTLGTAIRYGGVTLANSVTGTGSMVLSASPTLTGTLTAAVVSLSGQLTSTLANSTAVGGGQIYLNGATGNRIDWNINGVAVPAFTTRSAGTKLVLYPSLDASNVDYGFGMESGTLWSSVATTGSLFKWYGGTTLAATLTGAGALTLVGATTVLSGTAIPAGGTAGSGYKLSSTSNFGVFFGSGAPTLSAAKGSLYLRSDGTGVADRMYVNTNGSTTWTAVMTVA